MTVNLKTFARAALLAGPALAAPAFAQAASRFTLGVGPALQAALADPF